MTTQPVVAVTGGTGFVGQAVLDVLEREGLQVRALARTVPSNRPKVEWISGGLDDVGALHALVHGAHAVLHIAGVTNTPDLTDFEKANVAGTAAVLASASTAGVGRFVFVSSLAAREPRLSAYGASKERAEQLVRECGLDWTIIRPPGVYGPRDDDYLDMFKAARFGIVPLPPGGASSIIHVDDLAELLVAALPPSAAMRHKLFEPDDGREGGWSHKDLAHAIGAAVGRRVLAPHLPKQLLTLAAASDRIIRGNKAKLTADRVGYMCHPDWVSRSDRAVPREIWQPRIRGEDGLYSTAAWYIREGWL